MRPALEILDVVAPVRLLDGSVLFPGETVALRLDSAEPITVARAMPATVGDELRALVGHALQPRGSSPAGRPSTARERAARRRWRVG